MAGNRASFLLNFWELWRECLLYSWPGLWAFRDWRLRGCFHPVSGPRAAESWTNGSLSNKACHPLVTLSGGVCFPFPLPTASQLLFLDRRLWRQKPLALLSVYDPHLNDVFMSWQRLCAEPGIADGAARPRGSPRGTQDSQLLILVLPRGSSLCWQPGRGTLPACSHAD